MAIQIEVGADIRGAVQGLKQLEQQSASSFNKVNKSSGSATIAITNLGRVLQDAPFGFIGIANNLNPLLESFQRLQKETGGTGSAIKALVSSLMGAGGLGLALSAVQFFALGGADSIKNLIAAFSGADTIATKLKQSLKNVFEEGAKSASEQIAKITAIKDTLNDQNITQSERIRLIKEYNKIADETNRIDLKQADNLKEINKQISKENDLILTRALSLSATKELGTFTDAYLSAELKVESALKGIGLSEEQYLNKFQVFSKKRSDLLGKINNAGTISEPGQSKSSLMRQLDAVDAQIVKEIGKSGFDIKDAIVERDKSLSQLNSAKGILEKFITDGLVKGKFTGGDNNKPKINFFDEFIDFDPKNAKKGTEDFERAFNIFSKFALENRNRLIGLDELLAMDKDKVLSAAKKWWTDYSNALDRGRPDEFLKKVTSLDVKPVLKLDHKEVKDFNEDLKKQKFEITPHIKNDTDQGPAAELEAWRKKGEQIGKEAGSGFEDVFGDILDKAFTEAFLKGLKGQDLENLMSGIAAAASIAAQEISAIGTATQSFVDALFEGKDGMQAFGESVKNSFKKIAAEIAKDIVLAAILSALSGGAAGGGFSFLSAFSSLLTGGIPGHATGLDKVPYDNYVARLHKGEMVVPAAIAEHLRNDKTNSFTALSIKDKVNGELSFRSLVKSISGIANQSTVIVPDVKIKGSDLALVFNRTSQSQNRNFGR